jgi:acyl-CoA synthetase (NDP forming)
MPFSLYSFSLRIYFLTEFDFKPVDEAMETNNTLKTFFEPRGIVLVGARRSPGFGYGIPLKLREQGWGDRLHLVNPKGGEMHGMTIYRQVAEVPDSVDLAVVIVPAQAVPEVLVEIGERGIQCVIIESAGFTEVGDNGKALQAKAKAVAEKYGLRVIGPNCVGVVNTENRFTTVEVIPEALTPGNVAIIAQSGVFGNILLDGLYHQGLFISKAVTLGNRMDVNESEILDYLHQDPATRVIMMYLEGAADGRLLVKTLARVTRDKPVLILKSGRTSEGRAATASHTGSLSGEDELYEGVFAQTGAIRVKSLGELVEFGRVFATQPLPRGNRLGIVTSSGSLGTLSTDTAVFAGLKLPALSESTANRVREGAPEWMNVKNPLDVGPSGQFIKALTAFMEDPDIDMVLAITIIPYAVFSLFGQIGLTGGMWFGDIAAIRKLAMEKPFLVCVLGKKEFVDHMTEVAGSEVPVLKSPEMAAKALAVLWRYRRWREKIEENQEKT